MLLTVPVGDVFDNQPDRLGGCGGCCDDLLW